MVRLVLPCELHNRKRGHSDDQSRDLLMTNRVSVRFATFDLKCRVERRLDFLQMLKCPVRSGLRMTVEK
jgi:hypothetical protein